MCIHSVKAFPSINGSLIQPNFFVKFSNALHFSLLRHKSFLFWNRSPDLSYLYFFSFACLDYDQFRWDAFFRLAGASVKSPGPPGQILTFWKSHILLRGMPLTSILSIFFFPPNLRPIDKSTYCIHKLLQRRSTFITTGIWLPTDPAFRTE